MKIIIIQPRISYYIGGGEIYAALHAKYLSNLGHNVTIITTKPHLATEYYRDLKKTHVKMIEITVPLQLQTHYMTLPEINQNRWDYESMIFSKFALPILSKRKADLLVAHYLTDMLSIPYGKKSVLHIHGYPLQFYRFQEVLVNCANTLVYLSSYIACKWKIGIKNLPQTFISYNAIEPPLIISSVSSYIENASILFVGRLIPIKGIQYIIRGLVILKKKKTNLEPCLTIVGEGPERPFLQQLVRHYNLEKCVTFTGRVSKQELNHLYSTHRISIFPSYAKEGILTTILEAMVRKNIVITTRLFGIQKLIRNGKNGYLIKPQSATAIARQIAYIINHPKEQEYIREAARRTILKHWQWKDRAQEIEKIYKSILK
jgi:glycosyltransferase involved in cell wall biosynthesis